METHHFLSGTVREKGKTPSVIDYKGVPVPGFLLPECVDAASKYKPTKDDLFIVTYVKCGTTWMQHIVYLIQNQGIPPTNAGQFYLSSPYIELMGTEFVSIMKRPGAIKTHFPYHLVPFSPDAKYILVIRNPRDVIVSLHYHWLMFPGYEYNGTFDDSFENFMSGEADYGDYFQYYRDWYDHKDKKNVLFVVFEDLKRNPETAVLEVARFMGNGYEETLLANNKEILKRVLKYSHVDEMKKYTNDMIHSFFQCELETNASRGLRRFHDSIRQAGPDAPRKVIYVRKGIIGDWKNHFSREQLRRLNEKFKRETAGTELATLWPDMDFV
ncbi:putative sulfotransferase [Ixodes scapularis]|uniref:Sulfotransferase, putative n=2 Tax=Ixodes scapularis TaxID=6945 RepID=B7P1W8_IXOSC|nr:sulfotransferase, putative [Ixodes scapularis]|eukprot:XP_002433526.1 sulfotransferase, putative [Ixodes scapularis]